jgi:hypothetical protein
MRTRIRILTLSILCTLVGGFAHADGTPAGILLFPSFSVQRDSGQLYGDQNGLPFDFRAGYVNASGFYFGALYTRKLMMGEQYSSSESSLGNSVGYLYANTAVILSYYITSSKSEYGPGINLARTGGSGFQLDFAVSVPLAYGISLAPMLTYKSLVFNTVESQGVLTTSTSVETSLHPYLGFQYAF